MRQPAPNGKTLAIGSLASTSTDSSSAGNDGLEVKPEKNVNMRIRILVLMFLCLQNSGHALVARYSQKTLKEQYSTTEVVLVSELIKLIVSTFAVFYEKSESESFGWRKLLSLLLHSDKMIVLVILYSINNILSYIALGRVDAALYTVLSQLKILTTAGFMKVFFERNLSSAKWRALLLLVLGCILVASPVYHRPDQSEEGPSSSQDSHGSLITSLIGIIVVLIMVSNSGFASVYLESVLKKEKLTVWERNFQLSFLSAILIIGIIISERVSSNQLYQPFLNGFTVSAYLLAAIQAFGGICVAAALKYADSILKTLATCLAIVVTAVLEFLFMEAPMDIFIIIGCITTILAIANYTFDLTPDT